MPYQPIINKKQKQKTNQPPPHHNKLNHSNKHVNNTHLLTSVLHKEVEVKILLAVVAVDRTELIQSLICLEKCNAMVTKTYLLHKTCMEYMVNIKNQLADWAKCQWFLLTKMTNLSSATLICELSKAL